MNIGLREAHKMAVRALPKGFNVKVSAEVGKGYSWEEDGLRWTVSATTIENEAKSETDTAFTIALARLTAELARANAVEVKEVIVDEDAEEETAPEPEQTPGEETF